jgi:DNA-binding NarL/FixJ family response regulator
VQLYFPPAGSLSLAITTISAYRSRILKKLGLQSNAELTRYAIAYI